MKESVVYVKLSDVLDALSFQESGWNQRASYSETDRIARDAARILAAEISRLKKYTSD